MLASCGRQRGGRDVQVLVIGARGVVVVGAVFCCCGAYRHNNIPLVVRDLLGGGCGITSPCHSSENGLNKLEGIILCVVSSSAQKMLVIMAVVTKTSEFMKHIR